MHSRLAVAAVAALFLLPVVNADWGMFQNDGLNTGFVADSDYEVYEDVWWSVQAPGGAVIEASPVIKGGTVVIADKGGLVRALDAESGVERWNHSMGSQVVGTPAVQGDRVFIADRGGTLVSLDLDTGGDKESTSVGATRAGLTLHQGKIFIGNDDGAIKALDTDTLTELWSFSITDIKREATFNNETGEYDCSQALPKGAIMGAPVVYEDLVMFASVNKYVVAVTEHPSSDPGRAGKPDVQWTFETGDAIFAAPTLDAENEQLIVGSFDNFVYSIDAKPTNMGQNKCHGIINGNEWAYKVEGSSSDSRIRSSPAVDDDHVYFGSNDGNLYAIDKDNGDEVWVREIADGGELKSSPAIANGIVVMGSSDKNVYWLQASDGSVLKKFTADSSIDASPAIDGNRAFVSTHDGSTYMFGPEIPPRPDLVVAAGLLDMTGIDITLENVGNTEAAATQVRVILDGEYLSDLEVPALGAGNATTLRFDREISAGTYALRLVADAQAQVLEMDESNNVFSESLTVEEPVVDDPSTETTTEEDEDDGKIKIPGPGLALVALVLLVVAARRR